MCGIGRWMRRDAQARSNGGCSTSSRFRSWRPSLGVGWLQGDGRGSGCARELLVCEVGAEQHARVLVMQRTRLKMPTSRRDPKSEPRRNKYRETGLALQVEALSHDLGGARVGAAEAAEQHGERGANDCTEEVEHEQDRLGSGDAQRGRLSCRTCAGYRQSRAKQGRRQGLCKERRRRSDPTNQGSKRQAERGNRFYRTIRPYWMHTGNEERSEHSPETRSDVGALGLDRDG